MKYIKVFLLMLSFFVLAGCVPELAAPAEIEEKSEEKAVAITMATIKTNYGDIKIELFTENAPKTTANFIDLAESGFYNDTRFHRVIRGFMIQGGDPLTKDSSKKDYWGTGGPDYVFEDEIHKNNKNFAGTVAMANRGPNTNGSQFFINTVNNNYLDSKHTVFGRVIDGTDAVRAIENVKTEGLDRPVEDVIVEAITILSIDSD